ncbi:MAG: hypothetical protein JW982_16330 [Spirochaetes bacterium]|nr:hypothetical protein [Spirochaetota bacterium]
MKNEMTYKNSIHNLGRLTSAIVLIMILLVPLIISMYFGIFPPFRNLLLGLGTVTMIYLPISIAEFLTYTPMLGSSASYLVFVTGNLSNLKIPCALTCIENAGVKPQSEEADVIATIAVAVSSLVTTAIIFAGVLALAPLRPVLESQFLKPAFEQIIPALFGAMSGYWILKQWELAVTPLFIVILLFIFLPVPYGTEGALIPVIGLLSVISARIFYKRGWIKQPDSNNGGSK